MIVTTKNTLQELTGVISSLTTAQYSKGITFLSNATMGQHNRHIIEMFQELFRGYNSGELNYDLRKREHRIENELGFAERFLNDIVADLERSDKKLHTTYFLNDKNVQISSTYFREVMYNLEYTIHHEALIRIALEYLGKQEIPETFGIAPSTIQYRKTCAQ